MMLRAATLTALLILPQHLLAQSLPPLTNDPRDEQTDDAGDLFGRGIGMMLDRMMRDMQPELDRLGQDMSGALSRFAPVLDDLSVLVDDLANYQAPERLENGDVIIRRKPGAPPPPPIGDDLRQFTEPGAEPEPTLPVDPTQPEIAL